MKSVINFLFRHLRAIRLFLAILLLFVKNGINPDIYFMIFCALTFFFISLCTQLEFILKKIIKLKSKKEGLLLLGDDFLSLIEIILLLN